MKDNLPDHVQQSLEWHHSERDAKANEDSAPPPGEEIFTHCLWGVEFYPPIHATRLSDSLLKLGWTPDRELPYSQTPSDWIEHARSRPFGLSWRNLGVVTHESDRRAWLDATKARLPFGVSVANAHIHQITPSHTALVMQFVLMHEFGSELERLLRRRYRTEYRTGPGRAHFATPENQKQDAIQVARFGFRERIADWFSDNIPGLLSAHAPEILPLAEFTTVSSRAPFHEHRDARYMWLLEMDHDFDAWHSEALPGLRLAQLRRTELPYYLVLGGHKPTMLRDEQLDKLGGSKLEALTYRLTYLHSWIVRWALQGPLGFYEKRLASLRDQDGPLHIRQLLGWTTAAEESVELRRDALPFAGELEALTSDDVFGAGESRFTVVSDRHSFDGSWLESQGRMMNKRAVILASALRTSAETIALGSNVLVAKANILLTMALVILSITLLFISC